MTKKITLGNHLVPEILAHLNTIAALPSAGIVAGQALCSALLDLYGGGDGVYNDIDVFLPASAAKLTHLNSAEHLREEAQRLGLPVAELDEYKALAMSDSRGVDIAGSEQAGLINYVWCDTTARELLPAALVYGFDLNAVEVALDLENNELTWTRAFEEFLHNRELEVTSLATPERTLLRYLKKRQELPSVYGQDDFVKDMVATWMESDYTNHAERQLTTKMWAAAQQLEPALASHFHLGGERLLDQRLLVNDEWGIPAELDEKFEDVISDFVDSSGLTRIMPALWYAQKRAVSHDRERFAAELKKFFDERDKRCEGSWENVMHMSAAVMGGNYVRGPYSATHRDTVLRALEKHEGLNGALQGLTLEEQFRCVLDLAKRAKTTAGPLVYGYVESEATPLDMRDQHHRDQFFRHMGRERKGAELCTPLFPTYAKDGWTIRELYTTSALRAEGSAMSHCVGGYSGAVKSGRSRILSIRHAKNPKWASTVELRGKFADGEFVEVAQHYSYANKPPAAPTEEVFKAYLAAQCKALGLKLGKKRNPWDLTFEPLAA
jgi:hypothetical protein